MGNSRIIKVELIGEGSKLLVCFMPNKTNDNVVLSLANFVWFYFKLMLILSNDSRFFLFKNLFQEFINLICDFFFEFQQLCFGIEGNKCPGPDPAPKDKGKTSMCTIICSINEDSFYHVLRFSPEQIELFSDMLSFLSKIDFPNCKHFVL
jgi:hypothetical protein